MKYQENHQDVITAMPEYVTAHCISEDCAMGAGVVMAFREAFPGLKPACQEYMAVCGQARRNDVPIPYRHVHDNKVVYNMFTKKRYWQNATYGMSYGKYLANMKACLEQVRDMMLRHGETKLAMPKIGSGLDKCAWEDVESIIREVFKNTDIEILVCIW